jgi:hypothetical protein
MTEVEGKYGKARRGLVAILAPLVVLVVEFLQCVSQMCEMPLRAWLVEKCTFGRVTLGMMTVFNAEGASFVGAFLSPPGWYW